MAESSLYPAYIARDEKREIVAAVERVRKTGQSRAVLLYGLGGVGKTYLVRALADGRAAAEQGTAEKATWLRPIDMDDPEYWVLANLQLNIAGQLDPAGHYFDRYLEYLAQLPARSGEHVTAETVISRHGRIRRVFLECYKTFVVATGKPVVIVFNTVEAVRGMELLITLTQWMKTLPDTLFILSGRPMQNRGRDWVKDPIETELADPHRPMPVTRVALAEFSKESAEEYLAKSAVAEGLTDPQRKKIVLLTQGTPALAGAHRRLPGRQGDTRGPDDLARGYRT